MKKILVLVFAASFIICANDLAAENAEVEAGLKQKDLPVLEEQKLSISSYYEYSWIKLNGRDGQWRLLTNTLAYAFANGFTPYLEIDSWDRFDNKDQLINAGAYFRFKNSSYLHSEIGFGDDLTYLPKFRALQEYSHKMFKNTEWQFGYKYLNYTENDVHIVYPGIIYYFGDSYLSAFYNASFTESRGTAHWATLKGNFSLNNRLNAWLGTAVGERLYDVTLLKASKEYGYIIFSGFSFKIHKELKFSLGFSYSEEKPSFIKRSIDWSISTKF